MPLKYPQLLFVALFLFASHLGFSQTNLFENGSLENWSGSPEKPDSWMIVNENDLTKSADATDQNNSIELDLNNSLQFKTELQNATPLRLATNTTHTYSFDYKVKRGINVSAQMQVTKDGSSFSPRIAEEFIPFIDDGDWHSFSFDFDTNNTDEYHVFKLLFRANTTITGIVIIDNIRVLGEAIADADNDGVVDANDLCPNTPLTALAVDDDGCEVSIDNSSLLEDPSFEDWSFGGGANLAKWGINLIPGSSWIKNEDISDNLQYSVELTTGSNGSNASSIFQNEIQFYRGVEYLISIDYKVTQGSFNTLELTLTPSEGTFPDPVAEFTLNPTEGGWFTYSTTFTPDENGQLDLRIGAESDQQQQSILLDNMIIKANIASTDDDNDGVDNSSDQCPNTSTGETVDANGCSQSQLDDDNDGVTNNNDNCTNTPENTTVDANGCPIVVDNDADDDGVEDANDNCPNTPTGETVDANGCSGSQLDDDNDGVTNNIDNCANTPENTTVDANGCPIVVDNDADDDGVEDANDNCPNTPTGETANANGCSESQLDDDNDGVTNDLDNCPDTPANTTVDANGCLVDVNNDADDDGVTDDNDQCPNTPTGETVYTNGCTITSPSEPNIPNESIQVKVSSITCQNSENGEISVSFDEDYLYTVQITANLLDNTFDNISRSTGLVLSDLPADSYNVCVTIPEFPTFERCYTVIVETPEDFKSGKINIDNGKKTGKLVVSGSKNYSLKVNQKEFNYSFGNTGNQELSFQLEDGLNTIVATTDKECQGKYVENVLLNTVRTFPNPTTDSATITGVENTEKATITIYTINGKMLKNIEQKINDSSVTVSLANLPIGTYIVRILSDSQNVQTKIVRK